MKNESSRVVVIIWTSFTIFFENHHGDGVNSQILRYYGSFDWTLIIKSVQCEYAILNVSKVFSFILSQNIRSEYDYHVFKTLNV